jgi:hypothetical protein
MATTASADGAGAGRHTDRTHTTLAGAARSIPQARRARSDRSVREPSGALTRRPAPRRAGRRGAASAGTLRLSYRRSPSRLRERFCASVTWQTPLAVGATTGAPRCLGGGDGDRLGRSCRHLRGLLSQPRVIAPSRPLAQRICAHAAGHARRAASSLWKPSAWMAAADQCGVWRTGLTSRRRSR